MKTEAQKKAEKKYREKCKQVAIEFYPTEEDLVAWLEMQPKKQTYIKDLIRADLKKQDGYKEGQISHPVQH